MFRHLYRDLDDLLVGEEVDVNAWVPSWLRSLLAMQLSRPALLKLWDAYFTTQKPDWPDLHPYVCLVLVNSIKGDIQDAEDAERIASILIKPKLAPSEPSRVLEHARTARNELAAAGVI